MPCYVVIQGFKIAHIIDYVHTWVCRCPAPGLLGKSTPTSRQVQKKCGWFRRKTESDTLRLAVSAREARSASNHRCRRRSGNPRRRKCFICAEMRGESGLRSGHCGKTPRIKSAAFSASMKVQALMFAPGRSGRTEASTTRRFSMPRTRNCGSTTASSSLPMRQVPQA